MVQRVMVLLIIAVLMATLDQFSKLTVMSMLSPGDQVPLIPGLLSLVYWKNPGASFGLLGDLTYARWILAGVTLLAFILIVWFAKGPLGKRPFFLLCLGLVFGGALGNLFDRLNLGWVVDFILVYYQDWYWPAFNLADCAITMGGLFAAIYFWRNAPDNK